MRCLDVVKQDIREVGAKEVDVLGCGEGGVLEVGAREGEVFGCGEGGRAAGWSEGR